LSLTACIAVCVCVCVCVCVYGWNSYHIVFVWHIIFIKPKTRSTISGPILCHNSSSPSVLYLFLFHFYVTLSYPHAFLISITLAASHIKHKHTNRSELSIHRGHTWQSHFVCRQSPSLFKSLEGNDIISMLWKFSQLLNTSIGSTVWWCLNSHCKLKVRKEERKLN
jgi:hypothetical protein